MLDGVTKYDLQDRDESKQMGQVFAKVLNEPLTDPK